VICSDGQKSNRDSIHFIHDSIRTLRDLVQIVCVILLIPFRILAILFTKHAIYTIW